MRADIPTDPCLLTTRDLAEQFRAHRLSPVELIDAIGKRVDRLNPTLNAFRLFDIESARDDAALSEQRFMEQTSFGPMDGIPIALKDMISTRRWPTMRGSPASDPTVVGSDAPAVTLLQEAGAVMLGKTTTSEFAWAPIGMNEVDGRTLNPWNERWTTGGSSSGSGSQVAARMGVALGSDAGGSVRIPAAFCGIVGLKPTYAMIPAWPQSVFRSVSHLGPLGLNVDDCRRVLGVAASRGDRRDPESMFPRQPLYANASPISSLKVGVVEHVEGLPYPDPAIAQAVRNTADWFKTRGASVEPLNLLSRTDVAAYWSFWRARIQVAYGSRSKDELAPLGTDFRNAILGTTDLKIEEAVHAERILWALTEKISAAFGKYDLIISPSVSILPFDVTTGDGEFGPVIGDDVGFLGWCPYTCPFNLTGNPAISLPIAGTSITAFPASVQLVAAKYRDHELLEWAETLELDLSPNPYAVSIELEKRFS